MIKLLFCSREESKTTDPDMSLNNCSFSIYGNSPPEKQKRNDDNHDLLNNQICLPFHILVFYMKNSKHGILTEME